MRKNWIRLGGFLVLVAVVPLSSGQPPSGTPEPEPPAKPMGERPSKEGKAPPKSKLEEMLEQALVHNPDIRVAESKLREAEAELNRARLLVTQKVVTLNAALEAARANVATSEAKLKRLRELFQGKAVGPDEVDASAAALQQAKADLAKLEAEAPYITGQQPKGADVDPAVHVGIEWLRKQQIAQDERLRLTHALEYQRYAAALALAQQAAEQDYTARALKAFEADKPAADRVRAALNKPVTLELQRKTLPLLLNTIVAVAPDVPIHVKGDTSWHNWESVAPAIFKDVPLSVVLQWFEDVLPHHRAYVRDYGVLYLSDEERPPAGAVPLREFLKAGKTEAKEKPEKE
jgi:hypothetical protein